MTMSTCCSGKIWVQLYLYCTVITMGFLKCTLLLPVKYKQQHLTVKATTAVCLAPYQLKIDYQRGKVDHNIHEMSRESQKCTKKICNSIINKQQYGCFSQVQQDLRLAWLQICPVYLPLMCACTILPSACLSISVIFHVYISDSQSLTVHIPLSSQSELASGHHISQSVPLVSPLTFIFISVCSSVSFLHNSHHPYFHLCPSFSLHTPLPCDELLSTINFVLMNGQLFDEYHRNANMLGLPSCSDIHWKFMTCIHVANLHGCNVSPPTFTLTRWQGHEFLYWRRRGWDMGKWLSTGTTACMQPTVLLHHLGQGLVLTWFPGGLVGILVALTDELVTSCETGTHSLDSLWPR